MKSYSIRLLIIFGIITLVGIITFQVYWVKKTYAIRENHFNQTISVALFDVAMKIAEFNKSVLQGKTPVHQVSSNSFIVEVNDLIDKNILELFLKREFIKRNLTLDFEYAIYNCHENEMVFGRYVSMADPTDTLSSGHEFVLCPDCTYYFGIHFPGKKSYIISNTNVWFISSAILISAVIFFGWSLYLVFRQKRLSEIQRDFINNMTHEFKTPISTIAISSEVLLKEEMLNDRTRTLSYLGIISEQNERLREHVEKVLQAANIEKRKPHLEIKNIDIAELLKTLAESQKEALSKRGGSITVSLENEPMIVKADRFHLTNIMVNLLDNALKYTDKPPRIEVSALKDNNDLTITVSDNGIGIDRRFQRRIFDRFFRVPTGAIHNVKGFGLGLHYVRHAIKSHGWKISLRSEPGKGTQFIIKIPGKFIVEIINN